MKEAEDVMRRGTLIVLSGPSGVGKSISESLVGRQSDDRASQLNVIVGRDQAC